MNARQRYLIWGLSGACVVCLLVIAAQSLTIARLIQANRSESVVMDNGQNTPAPMGAAATPSSENLPSGARLFNDPFFQSAPLSASPMDPMEEIRQAHERMNQLMRDPFMTHLGPSSGGLFDRFGFGGLGAGAMSAAASPAIELKDEGDHYLLEVETGEDESTALNYKVEENAVVISGERKEEKSESKDKQFHRYESSMGSFEKRIALAEPVAPEKATSEQKKGHLLLTIPKKES